MFHHRTVGRVCAHHARFGVVVGSAERHLKSKFCRERCVGGGTQGSAHSVSAICFLWAAVGLLVHARRWRIARYISVVGGKPIRKVSHVFLLGIRPFACEFEMFPLGLAFGCCVVQKLTFGVPNVFEFNHALWREFSEVLLVLFGLVHR